MKILVSDFDKTLFTHDYLQNIKKINNFVEMGNMFIIATGRNYTFLKRDIDTFNINYSYIICNDGSLIIDKNGKVIYEQDINDKEINEVFYYLKNNVLGEIYIDNGFDYFKTPTSNNSALMIRHNNILNKEEVLANILLKFPNLTGYITENWIRIVSKNVDKYYAIKYLENLLNLNKDNIYTVGDGINDVMMIENYNGYCMKKESILELKKVCSNRVKSVSELIDYIINNN